MKFIVFVLTALLAGFIQGIAGFGSGPIQMMTYPLFWALPVAAAISVSVSVPLNLDMLLTYRQELQWKKVLLPTIPYMVICSAAISLSQQADRAVMKKVFGVFLILLAVYYLFFRQDPKTPMNLPKAIVYIVISALCDAFFGIGGPLMVLYFLSETSTTKEYLGTVAAFFLINGVYNTGYRIFCEILTLEHLPYIAVGIVVILAGVTIAHRLVDKLDENLLKRITYAMIGVTGVINLFS